MLMLVMVGKRKSTKMAFLDIVMSKNSRMAFLASGEFCCARDFCTVPEVLSGDFGWKSTGGNICYGAWFSLSPNSVVCPYCFVLPRPAWLVLTL